MKSKSMADSSAARDPRGLSIEELALQFGVSVLSVKLLSAMGMPGGPDLYRPIVATAREVARHFNVNRRTINDWKQRGMPERSDGTFDLAAIARWREADTGRTNGRRFDLAAAACRVVIGDTASGLAAAVDDLVKGMAPAEAKQLRERLGECLAKRLELPDCGDLVQALQECDALLTGNRGRR